MKVNDIGRVVGINPYQRNQELRDLHLNKKKQSQDQISISTEAKEMLDAQNRVNDPARAERIEKLKEAVSTGNYHVENEKIVEKLLPYFKSYLKSGE
ncbi:MULTISPECIES: flagellar biosynthesis anti-sigma factor FlgM [Paenibacillus]|jgi:negative regulator of flagellin synthesis FlgM|uniref:Negative regulator of flagellin synthesis n=2 Tax=Paenibacillus barengoltzii TaxID=343517 RepID=R9L6S9_9BACL|nr:MULTISPECIES: flagellar biosynthesis anti-sigma factor FlgM [Paenibacillus]EOS54121.1 flagellar biosynthesis anti-sigma factor FlgM [Paenibacillus barengoltzii G22]MDU0331716.1 flagellar biosynthesis anti-sigma factor FlgM [Paenibacillus sp. 3LSP]SME94818.1 anti-sigma-28 factor, FlgM family [Paenibacillus barengoltzii J12]